MKRTTLILLLAILGWGGGITAQTNPSEEVFFLERKSQEYVRDFKSWNARNAEGRRTDWFLRASLGYLAPHGLFLPASLSANLEVGYRWQMLEWSWMHTQHGLPIGTQTSALLFPFNLPTSSPSTTVLYNYELPIVSGTFSDHLCMSLHLPVASVPVFIKYGIGIQQPYLSNSFVITSYLEDGTKIRRSFLGGQKINNIPFFSSVLSTGFSNGPFFCSFDYFPNLRSTGASPVHQIRAGIQLTTGKSKVAPTWFPIASEVKIPKTRIGIAHYFQTLLSKSTTTSNGLELTIARTHSDHWESQLGWQYSHQGQGYQKQTPSVADIIQSPIGRLYLQNPLASLRRARWSLQYSGQPDRAVHFTALGGLGWHFSNFSLTEMLRFPEFRPTFSHYAGLHAGGGLRYRYFYSHLQINKVLGNQSPLFMEWSTGVQLFLGRY